MSITKKEISKIIEREMQEVLGSVYIVAPNTGNVLQFDLCGYFTISDCYGKTLKRYRTFEKAINYILLND